MIIARLLKMLTRLGYLVEEAGVRHIADMDADNPLASLQATSCPYRIAMGSRQTLGAAFAHRARPGRENQAGGVRRYAWLEYARRCSIRRESA